MSNQRQVTCPFCTGKVLAKTGGRAFAVISGFLQRSFNIKISTSLLTYLKERLPVSKRSAFKSGCAACEGKGVIPDPSDDRAKYAQVKANAESYSQEILELENKLAPACGNRYTVIQGSDLLEVGLGMNNAPSYRIVKNGSIRNKGLAGPEKLNVRRVGLQVPEGSKCNHVQGINSLASPGGHYMIKCSNKFSVVTGAQGVEITTGGPITISGGITRITGPEILLGTQTGRLSLQGDVVDIAGKSIEIAPTDGHLFVKGTISNTGNIITGGHNHSESISFVKGECIGKNETTKLGAPSDMYTGPAFWGGIAAEGTTVSIKDIIGFVISKAANPAEAQQILTIRFMEGIRDKMISMSYQLRPYELLPTGYILPGTYVTLAGAFPCNYGGMAFGIATGTVLSPITLNNFPHSHALPDFVHTHDVRVPDIDFSSDSAAELRAKQAGISSSAPLHKTSTSLLDAAVGLYQTISSVFIGSWRAIQGATGPYFK